MPAILIEILIFLGFVGSVVWVTIKNTASTVSTGVKGKMDEWQKKQEANRSINEYKKTHTGVAVLKNDYYVHRLDDDVYPRYDVFIFGTSGYAMNVRYGLPLIDEQMYLLGDIQAYLQDAETINESLGFIKTSQFVINKYVVIGDKTTLTVKMDREMFYTEYGYSYACLNTWMKYR